MFAALSLGSLFLLSSGTAGMSMVHAADSYVEEQGESTVTSSISSQNDVQMDGSETGTMSSSTTGTVSSANSTDTQVSGGKETTATTSSSVTSVGKEHTSKESQVKTEESSSSAIQKELQESLPPTLTDEKVEDNYQYSVVKNQTTEAFIQLIGEDAQQVAWENDLYASVMIAQAILETGSGNSQLSSPPNYNLFGIKGNFEGKSVSFSTQEDDGAGHLYTIKSKFRKYPSYKESLADYAAVLTGGLSHDTAFYRPTWKSNTSSYKDATAFLTGRYATDIYYGEKLNALIKSYQLTAYDKKQTNSDAKKQVSKAAGTTDSATDTHTSTAASEDVIRMPGNVVPKTAYKTAAPKVDTASDGQQLAATILGTQSIH